MSRVCLWGTSLEKAADEAQFLAVVSLVRHVDANAEITVLARPSARSMIYDVGRLSVIRTADVPAVSAALARADLMIMVGGCFMESPSQAAVCTGLTMLARLCRTPVVAVGVTAFPYRTAWGRQVYRKIFNAMEAVTVREPSAQAAISDLEIGTRIVQLADPRLVLAPAADSVATSLLRDQGISFDRPLACVTLRYLHDSMPAWVKHSHNYSSEAADRANRAIAGALDALASVAQLVLLPMHPSLGEDVAASKAIQAHMRDPTALRVTLPQLRAPELMAVIKRCDLILASRLAAGMFAVATATPFFGIGYEQRLQSLMSELGLEMLVLPWLDLDSKRLQGVAERAWTNRESIRATMISFGEPLIQSAWENAEPIARYVGKT
jgi:polysaccharide pyruvyl transferase WcaK-like protein